MAVAAMVGGVFVLDLRIKFSFVSQAVFVDQH